MRRVMLKTEGGVVSTPLQIGAGALEEAGRAAAGFPTVLLVTDENVAGTPWPGRVEAACLAAGGPEPLRLMLPAGEDHEHLETAQALCLQWLQPGAGRDAVVVAIGGGVMTDLAGFAASMYLRGIPWIAVPTTVLGMADASIGGKTGVNLAVSVRPDHPPLQPGAPGTSTAKGGAPGMAADGVARAPGAQWRPAELEPERGRVQAGRRNRGG